MAACLPLCFVITVWSATALPAMMVANSEDMAENDNVNDVMNETSRGTAFFSAEIKGSAQNSVYYGIVEGEEEVFHIFTTVSEIFENGKNVEEMYTGTMGGATTQDGEGNKKSDSGTQVPEITVTGDNLESSTDDTVPQVYVITFSSEDDLKTVFNLYGNTLTNTGTSEKVFLTDDQTASLKTALGID